MSHWDEVALQDVARVERSIVEPKRIADGTLFVGLENIRSGGELINVGPVSPGELASSKFAFTPKHLLYGKLRPYLAKIARPTFSGVCSTDILPVLPGAGLHRAYLAHFLLTPRMVAVASSRATGANLPRLSPTALAEITMPFPPLSEQHRIAEVLDRAEALRAKRRAALAQLDVLTQAIFLDMFGDPVVNSKGWAETKTLGDVADIVSGVTKGRELNGKPSRQVPYLAVSNVHDRSLDLRIVKTISATEGEIRRYRLAKDDLLMTEGGDPDKLGRGVLWNDELPECIHQNHIFRVRLVSDQMTPVFLNWLVGSQRGKRYFLKSAKQTTGIASINMKQLRGFPLLLPPVQHQVEFGVRIQGVEKLKITYRDSLAQLDTLFASLQHRAFRGEL